MSVILIEMEMLFRTFLDVYLPICLSFTGLLLQLIIFTILNTIFFYQSVFYPSFPSFWHSLLNFWSYIKITVL